MAEDLRPDEAVRALDEIRSRQQQVVAASVIPNWYWWATGGLMVVLSAGVDSHRPALIAVATTVFVVGLTTTILAVVLRSRAQIHSGYLGPPGGMAIGGFVVTLVGAAIGIAFTLRALGFGWPATGGNLVAGVGMGLGGPVLMRRLRTIMSRHAERTLAR
jgi:hypothetical protein